MQMRILWVVSLLSLAFGSFCFLNSKPVDANNSNANLKVGFVNLKNLLRDYKKIAAMEQKLNQENQIEISKMKALEEEVKELQDQIQLYRPGSPPRIRKEQELVEKKFEMKNKKERAQYFLTENMRAGVEQVYQEMLAEIEEYAKKNNYFMILKVADADFFGTANKEALLMQMNTREVLYWGKEDDITETIVQKMNERYKKEQSSLRSDDNSKKDTKKEKGD